MSKITCPACGLQMDPGAFKNCPQCHALIVEAASNPEPPKETEPETPPADLPGDEAPPNGEPDPETPAYAGQDAPPVKGGGEVPE